MVPEWPQPSALAMLVLGRPEARSPGIWPGIIIPTATTMRVLGAFVTFATLRVRLKAFGPRDPRA